MVAGSGLTAGQLLFGGDVSGNFVAFDPATGKPLWHTRLTENVSNAPQTYLVGGKQHVLVAAGDTLYSFALYSTGAKCRMQGCERCHMYTRREFGL